MLFASVPKVQKCYIRQPEPSMYLAYAFKFVGVRFKTLVQKKGDMRGIDVFQSDNLLVGSTNTCCATCSDFLGYFPSFGSSGREGSLFLFVPVYLTTVKFMVLQLLGYLCSNFLCISSHPHHIRTEIRSVKYMISVLHWFFEPSWTMGISSIREFWPKLDAYHSPHAFLQTGLSRLLTPKSKRLPVVLWFRAIVPWDVISQPVITRKLTTPYEKFYGALPSLQANGFCRKVTFFISSFAELVFYHKYPLKAWIPGSSISCEGIWQVVNIALL